MISIAAKNTTTRNLKSKEHKGQMNVSDIPNDPFSAAAAQYREASREIERLIDLGDENNPRLAALNDTQRIIAERLLPLIEALIEDDALIIHIGSVTQVRRLAAEQAKFWKGQDLNDCQCSTNAENACMNGSAIRINLNSAYDEKR